ncbi:MAG: DsbA family protein [Alphaproteobacteria bacterium]
MANSSSKGMIIGLVAVVVILGAGLFIVSKNSSGPSSPEVVSTSSSSSSETPASDAKPEPKSDVASSASSELTSPSSPDELTDITKGAKTDPAVTEDKEDKKAASGDSGSLLAGPAALDVDIEQAMADRSMGKEDAPVTMIEYASLTCPHCAHFSNDLLPEVKRRLIDTGKVKLVFRDYPLDTFAMKASLMARCAEPEKYFDLIEVIFKNQERWAKSQDPVKGLIQLGALAGMSEDFIKACMANEEMQSGILARVQDAQKNYKLDSTPTFIFNNGAEKMSGDKEVKDFENVVNKLIRK